jgi:hypothetical protein
MVNTNDREQFQEPRLVLYSPSSEDMDVPPPSAAAARARRRRLHHQHPLLLAFPPSLGTPPDPPAPLQIKMNPYGHDVPMDIIVHDRGASSLCSIVSEITQPQELSAQNEISNSDIAEMKRRLEAIKERRARIKGRQRQQIPKVVVSNQKKKSSRQSEEIVVETLSHSSYRNVSLSEVDPTPTDEGTVSFVPTEEWPTSFSATQPATPPRRTGIVYHPPDLLPTSGVSTSPKSAGLSTCRTFDETLFSYSENNEHFKSNSPWNVRSLLCTSNKPVTSNVDTGFGQIRSSRSMDVGADSRKHLALKENDWIREENEPRPYSRLPRASSFGPCKDFPEPPGDGIDTIHQEKILIGLETLPFCTVSSSYPRPAIPGKAYSEIISESSKFSIDPDLTFAPRSTLSSCLRKEPWYMTRRMKAEKDAECAKLLDRDHTMHAVVFMKQKRNEAYSGEVFDP